MKVNEIRKSYLEFFEKKEHRIVASDSLVPQNDPTLLFTGAGMNQFKEYFLGLKKDMKRAASSQKCLRTGDLDNVGKTPYHHSFFEMLGNFSFGDYFKEEAITWAWEYLTGVLKIPVEKLRVSVHHTDEEAYTIWRDKIKVRRDWIYKLGDEDNFWPANAPKDGPNGPCGPCSEIYFDMGVENAKSGEDIESIESERFAEIWNLVFTQFDRQADGSLTPLQNKNIDTGMGLERLAAVLQGKKSNFEIDIFEPILGAIEKALGVRLDESNRNTAYAITDHVRAVVFSMADGVIPSNEGRGYVIRKLIRRSLWHAHQLVPGGRLEEAFLYRLVGTVVKTMAEGYPELKAAEKSITGALKTEEERFLETLETGLGILEEKLDRLRREKQQRLPGEVSFELYDTYGFPEELTRNIAEKNGFLTDKETFEKLMDQQRQRAKQSSRIADSIFVSTDLEKKLLALPESVFLGYESLEAEAEVLFAEMEGQQGVVVLNQTPFYGESGGQIGDRGFLTNDSMRARVADTQKKDKVVVHYVQMEKGRIEKGMSVRAVVDGGRRAAIMRNHTATHLLHAALRQLLGESVRQLGSLVAEDRLRFDYSYDKALTAEQIQALEDSVNTEILKNSAVDKTEKTTEAAKKEGAIAFFGDKYGERVRVVTVPGFSKEFCGGTHCEATGQIGLFLITQETSVASGTRRIEAVTGAGAMNHAQRLRAQLGNIARELKVAPAQIEERIQKMKTEAKKKEKARAKGTGAAIDAKKILADSLSCGDYKFAAFQQKALEVPELRGLSDQLRSVGAKTVYLLGTESEEKINFVLGMSQDLQKSNLDLRELMKKLAPLLGATGGGRRDLIQGGGKNENQLQNKWQAIIDTAQNYLNILK